MAAETQEQALEELMSNRLPVEGDFLKVPTSLFVAKIDIEMPELPPIAFYEKKSGGQFKIIRQATEPYSQLALSAKEYIWIRNAHVDKLKQYADQLLMSSAAGTEDEETQKKLESLRRSAIQVMQDVFDDPSPQNIRKGSRMVNSFVYVIMRDPKAYLLLSRLSSHDPYTLQHSVGTAVNCIILARKLGLKGEKDLQDVGLAGLLHDIGKVRVRREIINKEGPLDELEWEEMRSHAEAGYEILKGIPEISERTKRAVLEHHEDKNGTGYPSGLKLDQTDIFSRIVAVSDIFNALTTDRTYSKAKKPFEAFQFMREKLGHKIDEQLFAEMVRIYGGEVDTPNGKRVPA